MDAITIRTDSVIIGGVEFVLEEPVITRSEDLKALLKAVDIKPIGGFLLNLLRSLAAGDFDKSKDGVQNFREFVAVLFEEVGKAGPDGFIGFLYDGADTGLDSLGELVRFAVCTPQNEKALQLALGDASPGLPTFIGEHVPFRGAVAICSAYLTLCGIFTTKEAEEPEPKKKAGSQRKNPKSVPIQP